MRIPVPVIDDDLVLTRERFEDLARDLVEQTVRLTASTVACSDAGPDQLAGVVLIGGSSRIPLVRRMLEQATGIVPEALPEPELVVAEGALHRLAPAGPPPPVPPPATARIRLVVRHLRDRWNIGTGVGFGALTAGLVAAVAPEPGSALLPAVVAGGGVFGFAYALNVVLALRRSDDALRHRP